MTKASTNTDYHKAKLLIGEKEFNSEEYRIDSIKIQNGCYDGTIVGVGCVYGATANIVMENIDEVSIGQKIEIIFVDSQGEEKSFGKFWVKSYPVQDGDLMTLECHGAIGKDGDTPYYVPGMYQEFSMSIGEATNLISETSDIYVKWDIENPYAFTNRYNIDFPVQEDKFDPTNDANYAANIAPVSKREFLAGIAIRFGGNVVERDGYVYFTPKTPQNEEVFYFDEDSYSDLKISKERYGINSISLKYMPKYVNAEGTRVYRGTDRVTKAMLVSQTSGAGADVLYNQEVECDWVGYDDIPSCFLQGDLSYRTGECVIVGYSDHLYPGNIVGILNNNEIIPFYIGEVTFDWDGGFVTTISCNCRVDVSGGTSSTSTSSSTSSAQINQSAQSAYNKLVFADITLSNIKDSTITGSLIADSTIKGSNIEEGTITGSNIKAATITGALIVDGTIRGNHIMESSIDGSKIKDSAITESKISNSSITNSKIKDGEIENSKIKDATLTGAKIQDATIGFEKVDTSFIEDLTADKAYSEKLKASIADIGYLTANEADIKYATIASLEVVDGKIENLETIAITTNNLSAKVADLGYLKADKADLRYANIELSNIDVANVGTFFASVGLIDRATIVDGHVTGFLDSVEVNANKITAGTLIADRILLKGSENGLLYALNNLGKLTSTTVDTLDGYVLTDRTINADKIVASSITTNELDVDDIFADSAVVSKIFAQNITATGVISGATLVGASISANKGTIGGFGIFDNWLVGSYEENGYQYQVELNTDKSYTDANGRTYAIYTNKAKKDHLNIENEWYVTYDGYMHAEVGEIAGFNFNNDGFIKESNEETVKLICYDNLTGGGLYVSRNNTVFGSLKADGIGFSHTDTNEYTSDFHLSSSEFYFADKLSEESSWRHPFEFSIGQGRDADGNYVHDPYFRLSVPAYLSTLECSSLKCSNAIINESSAVINVPTTIRNALRVESDPSDAEKSYVRINNHEVQLHAINSSVVFYLSAYSGSNNKFKLYSTNGNIVDVTDTTAMTITPKITASNGITEQGYGVVGCTVTKSGNFTCKKYRDGRLIIEFRFKTTSNVSLSNKAETYYATGPAATFPIAFTDVPAVVSGLGISNLNAPFCNVTFDSVTKTGFGRYIIWTLPTISGYVVPSGSVVSATFTGRWK